MPKIQRNAPVAPPKAKGPSAKPEGAPPLQVTRGWIPEFARGVADAVSDTVDLTVGLDTPGAKPITLGPVDPAAFGKMDAKVALLDGAAPPLSAQERTKLERGEILTMHTPLADGMVEERTVGLVDVPLEEFLKKVPAKDWGKNLVDWKGGEVRAAGPGRQVERMVLRMPGKDLDMTKVETVTDDRDASGKLQSSRVRWEVLKSDNGTVKQDVGTLKLERYGDKTLVTWHSAHALNKFPVATALLPKEATDAAAGMVLSSYFRRAIEHYRELTGG